MNVIRHARIANHLSQRMLARKASLSFRGLQLLEKDARDWQISSMKKIAAALQLPAQGLDLVISGFLNQDKYSVMITSIRILQDGDDSWPLHLFNFVDTFRATPMERLVQSPPVQDLDEKAKCLIASTTETLCADAGVSIPEWCRGIRGLREPWFVAGIENLKAIALTESPVRFRKRNIFVLGNFLDRA